MILRVGTGVGGGLVIPLRGIWRRGIRGGVRVSGVVRWLLRCLGHVRRIGVVRWGIRRIRRGGRFGGILVFVFVVVIARRGWVRFWGRGFERLELFLNEAQVEIGIGIIGLEAECGFVALYGLGPGLNALRIVVELLAESIVGVAEVVMSALLEREILGGSGLGKLTCGSGEVATAVGGGAAVVMEARIGTTFFEQSLIGGLGFLVRARLELF